jgi:hypothetical protein
MKIENKIDHLNKKFLDVLNVKDWEVETEDGWKNIKNIGKTIKYQIYEIKLDNGLFLKCADTHIVIKYENLKCKECFVKDLKKDDILVTIYELSKVISIENLNYSEEMYDLEIDSNNHTYFTNDILSHNSTFLCNLAAKSVLDGHNVAYITLELQQEIVNMRIGSNLLNIPLDEYEELSKDQSLLKQKITNLKSRSLKPLGELHIKEFPASTASSNDIGAYLRKAQELLGYKFENIFIDYINIMKNWRNPNTENLYMKIKQITEDVRAMGQENNWAIISPTQTNRCLDPDSIIYHKEKGKIKLKDLKINDFILGDEGYVKVNNIYNNKNIKTYKIKTKSGKELICSENHIFPVNNSLQQVSNMKIRDKIYIKKV